MLLMYTMSVSGSVVQLHFCGEDLRSFSVNAEKAKPCCCPVNDDAKDDTVFKSKRSCCSQTDLILKIDIDQSNNNGMPQLQFLQSAIIVDTIPNVFHDPFCATVGSETMNYAANAPPNGNWQQLPLYKLYHSLVYYG